MENDQPAGEGIPTVEADINQLPPHLAALFEQFAQQTQQRLAQEFEQRTRAHEEELQQRMRVQNDTLRALYGARETKPEKITVQPFDGEPALYPQFETGLRAKFRREDYRFNGEEGKLLFAIGLLQKKAAIMMNPWVQSAQSAPELFTLDNFFAQMRLQFKDEDRQRKASDALIALKQGQSTFEDYYAKFQRLLYESGNALTWDDNNKIGRFQFGMSTALQRATVAVIGTTFESYVSSVKIIAERLAAIDRKTGNWRNNNANNRTSPTSNRDAMDWESTNREATNPAVKATSNRRAKWVDERELQRRKENRLCLRCSSSEHFIPRCPYLPAKRPPTPKVSRVTEPPQLEDTPEAEEEELENE